MTDPLDPLDPELKRLFDAESRFPEVSAESKTRVLERVEAAVAAASAPAVTSRPRGSSAFLATGAFVAGTLVGALAYRAFGPPSVATPPVPSAQTNSVTAAPPASVLVERTETAFDAAVTPSSSKVATPSLRGGVPERPSREQADDPRSRLAEEQALVDAARAALARQRPEDALESIERHSRIFPRGELTEEREGLRVMALVRLGRHAEASRLAGVFERRYPRSPLLPVLRSALEPSP